MNVRTFRKKPVEIQAMEFHGTVSSYRALIDWAYTASSRVFIALHGPRGVPSYITVDSTEGSMVAHPGDWLIRGVQGEFYTCPAATFDKTYDEVTTE